MRRFDRRRSRHEFAQQTRRASLLGCAPQRTHLWQVGHRNLARRSLVQQRGHRLDRGAGHGPALSRVVQQQIAQCHDGHALVVRHQGADDREGFAMHLSRCAEVERLDEAIARSCLKILQRDKVDAGAVWRDLCC